MLACFAELAFFVAGVLVSCGGTGVTLSLPEFVALSSACARENAARSAIVETPNASKFS